MNILVIVLILLVGLLLLSFAFQLLATQRDRRRFPLQANWLMSAVTGCI